MSFLGFGANYNKPGPGIPKDAAQKTGAALFFDILGREFWSLWALGFIYILACLPIITIGPATVALSRVTVTMIRDQNVYVWRDFWDAFRKNIKQGLLFGIPATMFVASAFSIAYAVILSLSAVNEIVMALLVLWAFLGVSAGCFIFPLIAYVDLPSLPLLKNALLLIVLGKWRTIAATGFSMLMSLIVILYYPISPLFVLMCGYFSFISFFTSFMIWPVIDKYVVHGAELQNPPAEEPSEIENPD